MKVLLLANSFPYVNNKRTGRYNYHFARQFISDDREMVVAFFRMWMPGRKIITEYFIDDIKVLQLCIFRVPFGGYYINRINLFFSRFLGGFLLRRELESCSLIHSVDLCNNGVVAGYWARTYGKPHIAQAIGSDVNYNLPAILKHGYTRWIKNIDGIIANSRALESEIKKLIPSCKKIQTIYRGAQLSKDFEFISERQEGILFVFLGGIVKNETFNGVKDTKGGVTLMKAWALAEEELRSYGARLRFGGPYSNKDWVFEWRDKLRYPGSVEIIGELAPTEIPQTITKCDVVVVPSMFEGLPNVLLESYACRRPVIGSNAGGIPEVILDKKTGYVFERGNHNELAELLLKCSRDHDKNKTMGEMGYQHVKEHFNAADYTSNVVKFYDEILEKLPENS